VEKRKMIRHRKNVVLKQNLYAQQAFEIMQSKAKMLFIYFFFFPQNGIPRNLKANIFPEKAAPKKRKLTSRIYYTTMVFF